MRMRAAPASIQCSSSRRGRLRAALFLEARAAKHGPALGRFERNRGLRAALGARGAGFRPHALRSACAFGLALLAVLGVVLELFIVKEDLLARGKDKFGAAVCALQNSIGEFHGRLPRTGKNIVIGHGSEEACRSRFPVLLSECTTRARTASKKSGILTLSGRTGKTQTAMGQLISGCSASTSVPSRTALRS